MEHELGRRTFLKGAGAFAAAGASAGVINLASQQNALADHHASAIGGGTYDFDAIYDRVGTNSVKWELFNNNDQYAFMVLDNKKNLKMHNTFYSYRDLSLELFEDDRVNELEKCVILLQMFTFVGNDIYDENIANYPGKCDRAKAESFLKKNASYIEY